MYSAHKIADSINTFGDRITTFLITFPRFILAEFNTHRMFSRNSASSRAIPFPKLLKSVWNTPFIPIAWMKNHTGMQGTNYFHSDVKKWILRTLWLTARNMMIMVAWLLYKCGLTKQMCNRLLEPFAWHTVLVTATEWENFFALRAHPGADIHIQEIAYLMLTEYNTSKPVLLKAGEWHLPFADRINLPLTKQQNEMDVIDLVIKIVTARCAQTSYTVVGEQGKEMDATKLIKLHDRLSESGHWSPFEHIARAMTLEESRRWIRGRMIYDDQDDIEMWDLPPDETITRWCGNFRGFIQYRKTFAQENRLDDRVNRF